MLRYSNQMYCGRKKKKTYWIKIIFFRKINEAAKKQMDKLWHTTNIYMHNQIYEYTEKLVAKFPGKLKVPYKNVFYFL